MKSLLISSTYFPPQVGGISRLMERLALALGRERVCCLIGSRPGNGSLGPAGPRVYGVPAVFSERAKPIRALAWSKALSSILIRERPKAVLLSTVYDGGYGRWLYRWLRLPYVVYAYGNEILDGLDRRAGEGSADRKTLRRASRIIAVSRFTAGLVQRAGIPAERILLVNPGCDVECFQPGLADPELPNRILAGRSGDAVIMTVGSLVPRKGHDMVIQAMALLRKRGVSPVYLIVGDGPYRNALEELARDLELAERVIFAGKVSDSELPGLYSLADVFIMASRERAEEADVEGFGIVYLEANACGKPVIGGRSGGIPEAIVDGVTGVLVDPTSPECIASAIGSLLANPELRQRLGDAGRQRVVRDFGWDRIADRVDSILQEAAAQ